MTALADGTRVYHMVMPLPPGSSASVMQLLFTLPGVAAGAAIAFRAGGTVAA